ncbi:hypothetical protein HYV89_04865 [Candidatus Woesearchaeota archaeon]|nr:hypothetical protein [Candidatus Woesearchaeota archaeon]
MAESLVSKKERAVGIVKAYGPLLPVTLAKKLDLNITFASAILSELVDNKSLVLTSVKSGGSPFYYVQGQENKLQDLMKYLNGKDKDTAELLKKEKILRDRDLDNLKRFGLRQMKDFAAPIKVTVNNETDLFWKWYLADDKEVNELIGKYLESNFSNKFESKEEDKISEKEAKAEDIKNGKEEQKKLKEIYEQEDKRDVKIKDKIEIKTKLETEKPMIVKEEKIRQEKSEEKSIETDDENRDILGRFFVDNKIDIMDQKIIRKNKEINYVAGVNTEVGKGIFFLKYKDKGKINEADLSLAMHEAGKIPLIFLGTGELTKKARELLGTEFKGVIFKKI